MAISFAPMAADYMRHSRSERAAFAGAMIGYSVTQVLCYVIGLLALVTVARNPNDIYGAFIALPLGTVGFAILAARELDQSFADLYSTAVSTQNLRPLWDRRILAALITGLATVLALFLNIADYENFLTLLGSVFVPMFAVLAVDFFVLSKGQLGPFPERSVALADAAALGRRVRHLPAHQPRLPLLVGVGVDLGAAPDRLHPGQLDVRVDLLVPRRRGDHAARHAVACAQAAQGVTGAGGSGRSAPGGLVHGMGKEQVEPDWSPLTTAEVQAVLDHYQPRDLGGPVSEAVVTWRSPRPMSAAGLVRWAGDGHAGDGGDGSLFVKRHDPRVRTVAQLASEHAFAAYLRGQGVPVPAVLRTGRDATAVSFGGWIYEVHQAAAGDDLYRDAVSWSPFRTLGDAYAAGAALARLHRAAAGFSRPGRPQAVLIGTCEVVASRDPVAAVAGMLRERPGLARYLGARRWPEDLERYHVPVIGRAAPLLAPLSRQWGHGDWHPSNLTWSSVTGVDRVAGVFDFGLANRTFAVHDLAVALERSTVAWLDLADSGHAAADTDAMDALLEGYESVRPLSRDEAAALPEALPVVHLEYALSEIEYFADVVASPGLADLAYDGYLVGHTRWFEGAEGSAVTDHLRRRARRAPRRAPR